jgi:hypothetical protein
MTSLTSLYAKDLMLELAAREQRTALFRKSLKRSLFRDDTSGRPDDRDWVEVGVKSTAGVYER